MLDKLERRMTPEEFYAWQETVDEKYELVDGYPMKMMTGANRRHDQIVVNLIAEISRQLRGTACRTFTSDTVVRTLPYVKRRPDVGIECGRMEEESFEAGDVKLVIEVLSPSTREFNLYGKLDEYKSVATMQYVLLVEPNAPEAMLWSRGASGSWSYVNLEGLETSIDLSSLGLSLKLADIYGDLTFRPSPKLVERGGG
jgi:Uma2 family endonuclease